jgi:hypothetical protein
MWPFVVGGGVGILFSCFKGSAIGLAAPVSTGYKESPSSPFTLVGVLSVANAFSWLRMMGGNERKNIRAGV